MVVGFSTSPAEVGRGHERLDGPVAGGQVHEVVPDLGRQRPAGHPGQAADVDQLVPRVVEAEPDRGDQVGGVADEPGVGVVAGGPRLAGHLAAEEPGGVAGAVLDRAPQHHVHGVGVHLGDHLGALGVAGVLLEHPALGVDHPLDQVRCLVDAAVGPGPEGRGELEGGHVPGAERQGQHRLEHWRVLERPRVPCGLGRAGELGRQAVGLGELGHPVGLDLLHELHVDGVDGQPGGVPQGHLAVVGVAVVLEVLAVDDQLRRARVHRVDREAVVQRLGEHERLHGRAGLADGVGGVVELAGLEVPAAVHGPHRPVPGVDGDQRRLGVRLRVVQDPLDRLVGLGLHLHVQGGADPQAAQVDRLGAVAGDQVLADLLQEERCLGVGDPLGPGLPHDAKLRRHGRAPLLGRQPAPVDHGLEDVVAPHLERGRVVLLAVELGAADHAGEQGRLGRFEGLGLRLEVGAGGGVDPVGPAAEVHRVHVELEDLVLGELALQLDREHGLLELPEQGPVAAHTREGVLHVLLGDGRAALGDPVAQQVGRARPGQPAPGDGPVLVEVTVLGGQHRPAGGLGDLVQADDPAVLLGREGADLVPAGLVEEHDRLGGRDLGRHGHAGEGVDQPDDRAHGDGHGRHGQP